LCAAFQPPHLIALETMTAIQVYKQAEVKRAKIVLCYRTTDDVAKNKIFYLEAILFLARLNTLKTA
jgi:hypothetical protein